MKSVDSAVKDGWSKRNAAVVQVMNGTMYLSLY